MIEAVEGREGQHKVFASKFTKDKVGLKVGTEMSDGINTSLTTWIILVQTGSSICSKVICMPILKTERSPEIANVLIFHMAEIDLLNKHLQT